MIGSVTTHHPLLLCLLSSVTSVLRLCDHVRAWASNPGGMPLTLSAQIWADAVTGDQSALGFAYLFPGIRCRSAFGGTRTHTDALLRRVPLPIGLRKLYALILAHCMSRSQAHHRDVGVAMHHPAMQAFGVE